MSRTATIERETSETNVRVVLEIDGTGAYQISTGIPFFNHMLELFARHGLFDLVVEANGDLDVDGHHTVEDIGICIGQAFREALADKKGICRYGSIHLPMDEVLALVAVDVSGRPYLAYDVELPVEVVGNYDVSLTPEFLQALVNNIGMTLHVRTLRSGNAHHVIEAVFKGLARAMDKATLLDSRAPGIPSTKGQL